MESPEKELAFTGNWFIDAGILGFVNLMDEVYGWDLRELQKRIKKNPKVVYYGYFPFAYLFKWLSDRKREVKSELINSLDKKLRQKSFQDEKELFDFVWHNFICNLFTAAWVKSRSRLVCEADAYKKGTTKLKEEYNYKNAEAYLRKVSYREKIIVEKR